MAISERESLLRTTLTSLHPTLPDAPAQFRSQQPSLYARLLGGDPDAVDELFRLEPAFESEMMKVLAGVTNDPSTSEAGPVADASLSTSDPTAAAGLAGALSGPLGDVISQGLQAAVVTGLGAPMGFGLIAGMVPSFAVEAITASLIAQGLDPATGLAGLTPTGLGAVPTGLEGMLTASEGPAPTGDSAVDAAAVANATGIPTGLEGIAGGTSGGDGGSSGVGAGGTGPGAGEGGAPHQGGKIGTSPRLRGAMLGADEDRDRRTNVPAMLEEGEYVVRAESATKYGSLLEAINRDQPKKISALAKRLVA